MNYPVLLSLCLFIFAAYGIPVNDQNEEPDGIPADNQNEKLVIHNINTELCDIQEDVPNEESDNQNEESYGIPVNDQNEERIQGDDKNANETCSVCLANIPDTRIGICPHKFCKGCIDNWKIDKRIYRCPLCNEEYDNPDYQEASNLPSDDTNVDMTPQVTPDNLSEAIRTNDLSEATTSSNTNTENIVLDLVYTMRSIIMALNNTDDNTAPQETTSMRSREGEE
ncbi:uncharacterized protein LOC126894994 isoform X21 [Daktulosphaira vitifoliae]|uniref:uncharacterized protein LOC126894994 isoform X20 n=1 Tax=Daktulosphaira vitifoliae TaxID=58002 RepID=UPI0021AB04A4|nr:uncharacterized protein LOC126894994 isoform X20 [Daktulosphaira vitifoliae]XP_050522399.1 uncharacterized protein LOC126894994 isoform X21 [Daktulosphaira vitifoliae]